MRACVRACVPLPNRVASAFTLPRCPQAKKQADKDDLEALNARVEARPDPRIRLQDLVCSCSYKTSRVYSKMFYGTTS